MRTTKRIIIFGILVMLACVCIVHAEEDGDLLPGTTSYEGVVPTLHDDANAVTCADAGCSGTTTLQIEDRASFDGTYCIDATHCITIDATNILNGDEENSIDWSSNFDVECIVMKGNNGYDTYYCMADHKRADGYMSTPINVKNERPAGISHILVCYYPPGTEVPEFPAWFISLTGIAGLAAMLVLLRRK